MAKRPARSTRSQSAYCPACGEEFLTYNVLAGTQCPFCGRRVHTAARKLALRFVTLGVVVGLIAAGAAAFWLWR